MVHGIGNPEGQCPAGPDCGLMLILASSLSLWEFVVRTGDIRFNMNEWFWFPPCHRWSG